LLHVAATHGQAEVVRALLEGGAAAVDARSKVRVRGHKRSGGLRDSGSG
jgi:hypothetical protein